jgi:hypothetical protein
LDKDFKPTHNIAICIHIFNFGRRGKRERLRT